MFGKISRRKTIIGFFLILWYKNIFTIKESICQYAFNTYFFMLCMYRHVLSAIICVLVFREARNGVLDPLELKLQKAPGSCLIWILTTKL